MVLMPMMVMGWRFGGCEDGLGDERVSRNRWEKEAEK